MRLSQELRHDNIAATYHFIKGEEFPYLVMEYVGGEILTNYIYNQANHRLDEDIFLVLANQILDGIEHAHKKGIIHRDLKSSNIMITENGQIKIMDFGIAASLRETYSRSTGRPITISIHFASPEQINGDPPAESMDIYSLGCVFYEMLSGDPPFTQGDILHQQLAKKPKPIKHISSHLNSVILKCLEKRKEDSFKSVEELKLALKGKDVGVTVKIPKARKKKHTPTPEKRRIPFFLKAVVAFLFIALCISGYFLIYFISKKGSSVESKAIVQSPVYKSRTKSTSSISMPKFSHAQNQKIAMLDITNIATFLMEYYTDHGIAPAYAGTYDEKSAIYKQICPLYAKSLPVKDPWGNNYLIYSGSSSNGIRGMNFLPGSSDEFIVMSLGRDGEMDSWSFDEVGASFYEITSADDYNNDLVSWNGQFVRSPKTK